MNVSYDSLSNCVYSASRDKVFKVRHGSSLALIVGIPHKEDLMCMHRDLQNKRIKLFLAGLLGWGVRGT